MGLATMLLASQVKPGGMFDPSKIVSQLQGGSKPPPGVSTHSSAPGQSAPHYGQPQMAHGSHPAPVNYGQPAQQYAQYPQNGAQHYPQTYGSQQPQYGSQPSQSSYGQPSHNHHGPPQTYSSAPAPYGQSSMPVPSPAGGGYGGAQYNTTPSSPTPQHGYDQAPHSAYSSNGPPHNAYNGGYNGSPQPPAANHGSYDPNRGMGTALGFGAGAAAVAYGVHHLSGKQKLPFGASHVTAGPHAASDYNYTLQCLIECVQEQNISAFYPQGSLEPIAHHISQTGVLQRIANEWQIRPELTLDLVRLALFDVILFLDDSGSMKFEEHGSRIEDLKLVVQRATSVASLLDNDGLSIRFMNSDLGGDHVTNAQSALGIVDRCGFSGMTPLGTRLAQRVLDPLVVNPARQNTLRKPALVLIVTDGEPSGENRATLGNVIRHARDELSRTRYGPDALSIELAQVGNDLKAQQFLQEIDEDPVVGRLVDVTSEYEHEAAQMARATPSVHLDPGMYLVKLLVGGVHAGYDRKDEGGRRWY